MIWSHGINSHTKAPRQIGEFSKSAGYISQCNTKKVLSLLCSLISPYIMFLPHIMFRRMDRMHNKNVQTAKKKSTYKPQLYIYILRMNS